MTRRTLLVVYGLLVVVVQVGLIAGNWIPAPHNGGDNAGYIALAHGLLEGRGYVETWDPALPPHTKYPPVFPALLALPIALGARTWTALKLVPAAATVAAGLLTFLWAARRRTPPFGAAVAFLLTLSPGLLWYSHWILSDVPFVALTVLCLYALERGDEGGRGSGPGRASTGWIVVGLAAGILALFTRSAGLPLVVAVAGWLLLRSRWRTLAGFAVAAGLPAVAWWLRSARAAGPGYVGEFWMVDPYRPELGTVGVAGLLGRVVENAGLYAGSHLPGGLTGLSGGAGGAVALLLLALAAVGWGMRLVGGSVEGDGAAAGRGVDGAPEGGVMAGAVARLRGAHAAELFLPLYAGLILLWPTVWSGDRFALPLLPLLLFYAGEGGLRLVGRASRSVAPWVVAAAAVLLAVPALSAWSASAEYARSCAGAIRTPGAGPFACYGPTWAGFVDAAAWSGANLPPGEAVLTRKPRIFYVVGGTRSRTYPFTTDPATFLGAAADAGARYVLLDNLDRQGATYVGGVVAAAPEAFCSVERFDDGTRVSARLLGIVDPAGDAGGSLVEGPDGPFLRIPPCPADLRPASTVPAPSTPTLEIPLLTSGRG